MIQAGYNPLAMVVLVTKMPGSNLEIIQGKPANSERAMNVYERNSNKKKLEKFTKEQEKNKALRAKNLAQYKATGLSGWDTTYEVLKSLSETSGK